MSPDTDPNLELEQAIYDASHLMLRSERSNRVEDAYHATMVVASHVRGAYDALCGPDISFAPMPPEMAQWHLIQVHGRALAAYYAEERGKFGWQGQS